MNHSCDSSAWMDDVATLVAPPGYAEEEVTVDYALFTTQSNWMLDTKRVVVHHSVAVSLRAMTEMRR